MQKSTSLKSSSPRFELNALAPLRVGGLAKALLENAEDPAEVRRIAGELLDLEPHLLELLVAEGDRAPELEAPASLPC